MGQYCSCQGSNDSDVSPGDIEMMEVPTVTLATEEESRGVMATGSRVFRRPSADNEDTTNPAYGRVTSFNRVVDIRENPVPNRERADSPITTEANNLSREVVASTSYSSGNSRMLKASDIFVSDEPPELPPKRSVSYIDILDDSSPIQDEENDGKLYKRPRISYPDKIWSRSAEDLRLWKSLPASRREKTLNRINRELCRFCTQVVPREAQHLCTHKGVVSYKGAVFMVECIYCKKMFKDEKQMLFHMVQQHLGILCWACPFCWRCFQNSGSYLRHIQWEHGGLPAYRQCVLDEFGPYMPCPERQGRR